MTITDTVRFDRRVAQVRELAAQGADIILEDTSIGTGAMRGSRYLVGGEVMPASIVYTIGSDAAYIWHHSCDPTTPGHDRHGYPFTLVRPARNGYDVIVSLLYDNDDLAWLTERLADMLA